MEKRIAKVWELIEEYREDPRAVEYLTTYLNYPNSPADRGIYQRELVRLIEAQVWRYSFHAETLKRIPRIEEELSGYEWL